MNISEKSLRTRIVIILSSYHLTDISQGVQANASSLFVFLYIQPQCHYFHLFLISFFNFWECMILFRFSCGNFFIFFLFLIHPFLQDQKDLPKRDSLKRNDRNIKHSQSQNRNTNPLNIKVENLFFLTFSCLVVVVTFLFGYITEYGILNGFTCSATKDVEKLWLALR